MKDVIAMLKGGDRRSIGRVNEVVRIVDTDPESFRMLLEGLLSDDEVVRMRCADAIEKVAHTHSNWLNPHAQFFLEQAGRTQQEIRWHMAQIIPRLSLTPPQRKQGIDLLMGYLKDRSAIVRVSAMQALVDFSDGDSRLRKRVVPIIEQALKSGTPAMKARGRRLLRGLRSL